MVERPDVVQIGLCASDAVVVRHVTDALKCSRIRIVSLPDPTLAAAAWQESPCALVIFDPFRMQLPCDEATALARALLGPLPMLALTPHDDAGERTLALLSGADDAVFAFGDGAELAARVAALIRRAQCAMGGVLVCDDLKIDVVERRVCRAERQIAMPLREFDLLAYLARQVDRPVSRTDLLRAVWNLGFDPGTNRVDVHMSRLRQRVDHGHTHAMLRTIKGIGYALVTRGGERALLSA